MEAHRSYVEYTKSQQLQQQHLLAPYHPAPATEQGNSHMDSFHMAARQANEEAERAKAALRSPGHSGIIPGSQNQPTPSGDGRRQGNEYLNQIDNEIEERQRSYVARMQQAGAFAPGFNPPESTLLPALLHNPQLVQHHPTSTSLNNQHLGADHQPNLGQNTHDCHEPNEGGEQWNLVGDTNDERNLAQAMQISNQNPPGAPGGLGHS